IRRRTPFEWKGLDSDNGSEFINEILYKYCDREGLEFTRSRPNRKNDNAYNVFLMYSVYP
ncbi:MAG: transposase, partial [Dehalococcoidia bacterium]|nr:transposase [Dehalococcoidia bacterium]